MAEMKLKLKPFIVPSFVVAELPQEVKDTVTWALRDVDAKTLAEMCDEFRRSVFVRAEQRDPDPSPAPPLSDTKRQ